MDFAGFRTYVLGSVRHVFDTLEKDKELVPMVLLLSGAAEKKVGIIPVGQFFADDVGKTELLAGLSLLAECPECEAIAIVSEIWTAKVAATDVGKMPVFQRDDRTEGVMVRLEARSNAVELWVAPVSRNPDGTRVLAEFESMPCEEGRMARPLFLENRRPEVARADHVC